MNLRSSWRQEATDIWEVLDQDSPFAESGYVLVGDRAPDERVTRADVGRSGAPRVLLVGNAHDPDLHRVAARLDVAGAEVDVMLVDRISHGPSVDIPARCERVRYDIGYCRGFEVEKPIHFHFDRTLRRDSDWAQILPSTATDVSRQAQTLLWGWLNDAPVARWLNSPWALRDAENKLIQLAAADRAGLMVPDTLVTSCLDDFRRFARRHPDGVIHKSLSTPVQQRDDGSVGFLYSTAVTVDSVDRIDYPALFQRRLRPRVEYRVTVVGRQVFVAALRRSEEAAADWRRDPVDHQRFEHGVLPESVVAGVRDVMRQLRIEVGSADLIETDEGIYFLEINPSAALLWLERTLGMQLCQSVASLLLSAR